MTTAPAQSDFALILDHVADAVTIQGADGRIIHANRAALELTGFPTVAALVEATPEELLEAFAVRDEHDGALPWDRLPGTRALLGETPDPLVVRWRRPRPAEPERWSRIKSRGVRGPDGAVRMAVNLIEDITEIKLAELGHRFLAEAGRVLASSLNYEETLRRVAELAIPEIADWCMVDLASPGGSERVAVTHADPAKLAVVEELMRRYPTDPTTERGAPAVMRTGVAELFPVIPDELLVEIAEDDEHLALLRSLGMTSAMVVPLRAHHGVVGAVTLVSARPGRPFGDSDLRLAEELGRRAGVAVENARLYQQRSEIARILQQSLLPPVLPDIDGVETAAVFRAVGDGVEVGGDFYDLFATEDHWFAVIGDVCGKGATAAATTALARYTIRAAAVRRRSPAGILRWLNDAMLRQREPGQPFCTLAVVRLDPGPDGVGLTVAGAGHPIPRIVRADGRVESLGRPGTLMGVTDDIRVEDRTGALGPGDTLVLYTDGLTEARAPRGIWDDEDLDLVLAEAPRATARALVDGVTAAALGASRTPARDDIALLAVRARPA